MSSPVTTVPAMKVIQTALPGVLVLEPRVFADARGFFLESYNEKLMAEAGIREHFVQDNHSYSARHVLRGLHYQVGQPQGKLIRVITGEIFDVAVDLRRSSAGFGKWLGTVLSGDNKHMLWVPPGLAHGFHVRSENAHVLYKASGYYAPEEERTILWNDPELAIAWGLERDPILSAKDARGVSFREAEKFA
jgi:dTDP-4-dehydrorhamnose 3,5-epimerase